MRRSYAVNSKVANGWRCRGDVYKIFTTALEDRQEELRVTRSCLLQLHLLSRFVSHSVSADVVLWKMQVLCRFGSEDSYLVNCRFGKY